MATAGHSYGTTSRGTWRYDSWPFIAGPWFISISWRLRHPHARIRFEGAQDLQALSERPSPDHMPWMRSVLEDPNSHVVRSAAMIIARYTMVDAIPRLRTLAAQRSDLGLDWYLGRLLSLKRPPEPAQRGPRRE